MSKTSPLVHVTFRIKEEERRELKSVAAMEGTTYQSLLAKQVRQLLRERRGAPSPSSKSKPYLIEDEPVEDSLKAALDLGLDCKVSPEGLAEVARNALTQRGVDLDHLPPSVQETLAGYDLSPAMLLAAH